MSGPQGQPVEQVATELIAADVAATSVAGRYAKSPVAILPDRTWNAWWLVATGVVALLVLVGGGALALNLVGGPQPTAVAGPTPSPTAGPTPTPARTPTPTPGPTPPPPPPPTPTPTLPPPPTPTPIPPVTGDSIAVGAFERLSGDCPIAPTFNTAFDFVADDGALTMTQLPIEHVTTGTITRTGPAQADFVSGAEGQSYEGTITGSIIRGTHLYTAEGCNDEYAFELKLLRPFVADPPFGDAPAHFEFLDPSGTSFGVPVDQPARIVVASLGEPNIAELLPIRVVLTVGGETPWDFLIENADEFCTDATTCYADAPTFAEADWFAPDQQPLLIAYDPAGNVLAVFAPNGLP